MIPLIDSCGRLKLRTGYLGRCSLIAVAVLGISSCGPTSTPTDPDPGATTIDQAQQVAIRPVVVTQPVTKDSDDPAIWLHPDDPSRSLILGTDKVGAIFTFDLQGKIIPEKSVTGMGRINNIDVAYGVMLGGAATDIAVATDRNANLIRAFRLPAMTPIDGGGIEAFEGEAPELRRPMGLALYTRPSDGELFAIVSRKAGPSGGYLWQYRLEDDGSGNLTAEKVREFGSFSGVDEAGDGEIEAIAVDAELGYVYYSDERGGIKKYRADPDAADANVELAVFGTDGFAQDREGISIYTIDGGTGYILVSDQQANAFRIFRREGEPDDPHNHQLLKVVFVSANDSDGSEVTNAAIDDRFPSGLFVAMSDDRTFHLYSWEDIAGDDLVRAPNGVPG
jgi:myo-inositol-hexaphosphate 3-phosphohydrolase